MVVLAIGGVALRGLVGPGRAERERPSGSSSATDARAEGAELTGPAAVVGEGEAQGVDLDARTEVAPSPAEVRAPKEVEPPVGDSRSRTDLAWWGLCVDGETELSLPAVSFAVLRSQPDGSEVFEPALGAEIEVEITNWDEEVVAARCPGYATAFVLPSGVHRSRGNPQRILLWREATLAARVEGGTASTRVSVRAEHYECIQAEGLAFVGWEEFRWPGVPGEVDTRVFGSLPAKVELTVEAEVAGRIARRQRVVLEPGERREISLQLSRGASIQGRALDPQGKAVPGIEVWGLPDDLFDRRLGLNDKNEILARCRTEVDGSFVLSDLAPGEYMVGPSPGESSEQGGDAIAPVATRVTIGPDDSVVLLTLICWRGLTIRGLVLGSNGAPALGAIVDARGPGDSTGTVVGPDGSFSLGPLVEGTFRLRARGSGEAPSVEVEAQAGDHGLELRLRAAGHLSVRVLDEGSRGVSNVQLELLPWVVDLDDLSGMQVAFSGADGNASFRGILPGTYALQATSDVKLALRTDLEVTAGGDLDVELVLAPAVPLKIRLSEREESLAFRLRWKGCSLRFGAFDGLEAEVLAPPSDVTVELVQWSRELGLRVLQEKSLRLVLGQPASVRFDPLSDEPR